MNQLIKKSGRLAGTCIALVMVLLLGSCYEEQHPGTYYTFSGQTVADFLEQDPNGRFSDFIEVLKKCHTWGELDTYGEYTCFAPTNDAFPEYFKEMSRKRNRTIESVEDLTYEDCDTIARTHLIRSTFYMSDLVEGALPSVNLLDRFLTLSYDSALNDEGRYRLRNCINKNSHILELDDSVENGVVQVVDSIIKVSGEYIFDILKLDTLNSSIFFAALNMVGLEDSLKKWKDESYSVSYDSVYVGVDGQGGGSTYRVYYWGERKVNFTILVEPDSVFRKHEIYSIKDLINHANEKYHESYPNDLAYDTLWHDRRNPLNRFVSYHILPFAVPSVANFNYRNDIIKSRCILGLIDPEDYFETYLPHSIMRVSTVMDGAEAGVYINRRGVGSSHDDEIGRPYYRGVKIVSTPKEVVSEGCNGYFHYLDDILEYSYEIRNDILNRRMRIDCCTLSPDFMTSGARQRSPQNGNEGIGFLQPDRFHSYSKDYMMWVRSAVTANWSYQGDGVDLMGNYDIMLKLPPVPFDGTWELRLSYRGFEGCGIVQNYVGDDPKNLLPCGIPTDLTLAANTNPNIGWLDDENDLDGDEEKILAHDKAMHNRGYMKGPDSHSNGTDVFRKLNTMARRIITTDYFLSSKDYYLRMKLVKGGDAAEMNFDYMEWCPKSIYDFNEDKH